MFKWVSNLKEFYNDINPATLSGAIDVIVIRQPDGSLKCSPFHVRFGKLYLLRPKEKVVHITINDEPVNLNMKIGEAGEAFFTTETDDGSDANCLSAPASVGSQSPTFERKRLVSETSDTESTMKASSGGAASLSSSPARRTPPVRAEPGVPVCEVPPDQIGNRAPPDELPNGIYEWKWGDFPKSEHIDPALASESAVDAPGPLEGQSSEAGAGALEPSLLSRIGNMWHGRTLEDGSEPPEANGGVYLSDVETVDASSVKDDADEDLDAVSFHSTHEEDREPMDGQHEPLDGQHEDADAVSIFVDAPSLDYDPNPSSGSSSEIITPTVSRSVDSLDPGSEPALSVRMSLCDPGSEPALSVRMSLCGKPNRDFMLPENVVSFEKHLVTFDAFNRNPAVLSDRNLVVCCNGKYYDWQVAAPIIMSQVLFQRDLDDAVIGAAMLQPIADVPTGKLVGDSQRSWFSYFKRDRNKDKGSVSSAATLVAAPGAITAGPSVSAPAAASVSGSAPLPVVPSASSAVPATTAANPARAASPALSVAGSERPQTRSLRLTSEQLQKLNLREGINKATFTIISRMQGKHTVTCYIYLWNHDVKVVISDIDGTITRSDVMGHVAALLSKDWTHAGVASLFTAIEKNGYKFVFLSSRSISHAGPTRGYLKGIVQKDMHRLPDGPILLSPSSLFQSIHREVIKRRPEEFKVACLRDIRRLFPKCTRDVCLCCCGATSGPELLSPCTCVGESPFTAGFGNRVTDELSYLAVGVPPCRIFTIDPSSQVRLVSGTFRSSYEELQSLVDQIFPPRVPTIAADTHLAFNDFAFWRDPLPVTAYASVLTMCSLMTRP